MAKKKLKTIFIILLVIVLIIVIIPLGGFLILKFGFDIDLIAINKQIKLLSKEVDESSLISLYGDEEKNTLLEKLKNAGFGDALNGSIDNLFLIAENNSNNISLTKDMILNEKELAYLLNKYVDYVLSTAAENDEQKSDIAELNASVLGIEIDNIRQGDSVVFNQTVADITVVAKINIQKLKETVNVFPISIYSKKLPDELYIKSQFSIKTTADGDKYEYENSNFAFNSMSVDETKDFMKTMQFILGNYDEMSNSLATMFCEIIVSDGKGTGLVDTFNVFGLGAYNFTNEENEYCIIYKMA